MTDTPVAYEALDGVGWITLNRPAVLNALNTELAATLVRHVEAAATVLRVQLDCLGSWEIAEANEAWQERREAVFHPRRGVETESPPSGS